MATDAIVQGLQLKPQPKERLYETTANRIEYYQRRNVQARVSHTRTAIDKLHRMGIMLTGLPRCEENTS